MDDDTSVPVSFQTPEEELGYWRGRALRAESELQELSQSFDEFQTSSLDLEKELERELEQAEEKLATVSIACERLQKERSEDKAKYQQWSVESNAMAGSLTEETRKLRESLQELTETSRKLEQENDDLERTARVATASVDMLSTRLDTALEHQVFLQTELEVERASKDNAVERLKQELREMHQDLLAKSAPLVAEVERGKAWEHRRKTLRLELADRQRIVAERAKTLRLTLDGPLKLHELARGNMSVGGTSRRRKSRKSVVGLFDSDTGNNKPPEVVKDDQSKQEGVTILQWHKREKEWEKEREEMMKEIERLRVQAPRGSGAGEQLPDLSHIAATLVAANREREHLLTQFAERWKSFLSCA